MRQFKAFECRQKQLNWIQLKWSRHIVLIPFIVLADRTNNWTKININLNDFTIQWNTFGIILVYASRQWSVSRNRLPASDSPCNCWDYDWPMPNIQNTHRLEDFIWWLLKILTWFSHLYWFVRTTNDSRSTNNVMGLEWADIIRHSSHNVMWCP